MSIPWISARALAVITILFLTRSSIGKGPVIWFPAASLTYFLNDDVMAGKEIATIRARVSGSVRLPHYFFTHKSAEQHYHHSFLKIDTDTGKITLRKTLKSLHLYPDGTKRLSVTIKGCTNLNSKRVCAVVQLFIIALRENLGDKWIAEARSEVTIEKLINHIIPEKKEGKGKVTPSILLRKLRESPKEAANITLTAARQEMVIDFIRKTIVKKLGVKKSGAGGQQNLNFDCLHVEKLFSLKGITRLLDSDSCKVVSKKHALCYGDHSQYRTYDGTCNNLHYTHWGAAGTKLERMSEAEYVDPDRLYLPKGSPDEFYKSHLPPVSEVSRLFIHSQSHSRRTRETFSHALMQWGQFLDHDIGLSPEADGADKCEHIRCDESLKVSQPPCFPIIPADNSSRCIRLTRSAAVCQDDPSDLQPREQINVLTSFVDGSQIYGSSKEQAESLRSKKDGLLKMSKTNLLILNHGEIEHPLSLCEDMGGCFHSGDARVNEQVALASIHTLFNREHNRISEDLKKVNVHWNDEKLFQETRKIVGAILQKITYEDFLPKVLGKDAILPFQSYESHVHPGILNEFSTAAFRFGHSLIRPFFDMLDNGYNRIEKPLPLKAMFFNNLHIQKHGIEPILLGLLANMSQDVDPVLAKGLTDHLFEREDSHGLNLASLNIQRGRDHGLAGYNTYRKLCGLKYAKTFDDLSLEIKAQYRKELEKLYKSPDDIDLWVAGLAEDPLPDAAVGPTFQCILKKQFQNLRDGDRFYYEEKDVFTREQLREIKKVTLSHVLCNNLKGIVSIQRDAFIAPTCKEARTSCQHILRYSMNLDAWKDHDPCFSKPCWHSGHCNAIDEGRDYECLCSPYWKGKNCQYRNHPCNPSHCHKPHDMSCRSEFRGAQFECICLPGMHHCNNQDFCSLGPCPTGYRCQKKKEIGYLCIQPELLNSPKI